VDVKVKVTRRVRIYNGAIGGFQYHERFVGLWLNVTVS